MKPYCPRTYPTPQYLAATRRAARRSVLLLLLVVVAVVLAMPVVYWSAVLVNVSLYRIAPVTLCVLLVGAALLIAIGAAWAGAVRETREEAIQEANRGRIFGSRGRVLAAAGKFRQGRVEAGARERTARRFCWNFCCGSPGPLCTTGCSSPGTRTLTWTTRLPSGTLSTCWIPSSIAGANTNGERRGRRI